MLRRISLIFILSFVASISNTFSQIWSGVGNGLSPYSLYDAVKGFGIYHNRLYIGGEFDSSGSIAVNNVAIWDGNSLSSAGDGTDYYGVHAFAEYNGELYAGGGFNVAGGITARHIAKWNDTTWAPVGTGVNWHGITCMAVFNGEYMWVENLILPEVLLQVLLLGGMGVIG